MATRSGGGSGGVIIALVAFVFLFVVSTALAVLFYSQKVSASNKAESNRKTAEEFMYSDEKANPFYDALDSRRREDGANRSLYGQLKKDHDDLLVLINGDPAVTKSQVMQIAGDKGMATGDSLMGLIDTIQGELDVYKRAEADRQRRVEQMQATIQTLQNDFDTYQINTQQTIDSLGDRVNTQKQDYDDHLAGAADERQDFADQHERVKDDLREQIRTLEAELVAVRAEVRRRDGRIRDLENQLPKLGSPDTTLEHDARVLRVSPAENLVVIDIGRNHKVILGMMFEIFDAQRGVRVDEDQQGNIISRGKATAEVIRFSEDGKTATCRIVRQDFGATVVSGDLVSNLVYDKNRIFQFYVAGEFDLDNDGRATTVERRRIITMIEQWGGEVIDTEEMPVDTDFLVLGREPDAPRRPGIDATENEWRLYNLQQQRITEYSQLRGQALQLNLPILSQNRFLSLVGYTQ